MNSKEEGVHVVYDLEQRTLEFSRRIIRLAEAMSKDNINDVIIQQIVRSGTSVGANYREANDALGDKDFLYRMRIARKEAKETVYWLRLVMEHNVHIAKRMTDLFDESSQLVKLLSSIISNTEKAKKSRI